MPKAWPTKQDEAGYCGLQIGHRHLVTLLIGAQPLAAPENAHERHHEDDDVDDNDG